VLCSDEAFRPNVPVNVLVEFETLKSGFGWRDEEAYGSSYVLVGLTLLVMDFTMSQSHLTADISTEPPDARGKTNKARK